MTTNPIFEVDGLRKRFGGLVAVDDLSFQAFPGETLGLIGPNGAGKTTVLNLITGLYTPDHGVVWLDGRDITRTDISTLVHRGLVRTFQSSSLYRDLSVRENISVALLAAQQTSALRRIVSGTRQIRDASDRARELLAGTGLADVTDARAGALPYGRQRMVGLTMALSLEPKVLLLDEPAAGMNDEERQALVDLLHSLHSRGVTTVLIEHDVPLVMAVCDRIVVMNFGQKVSEGSPEDVRRDPVVIEAYLGRDAA